MTYFEEFRKFWPNLFGSCLGLSVGYGLVYYMINLFGPPLIQEFGWSKAEFAFAGTFGITSMVFMPIAGRFVDRFGPRMAASIGFAGVVASLIGLGSMSGSIVQFYTLSLLISTFGVCTSALVFARVIVDRFQAARGLALGIAMSGTSLVVTVTAPLLVWVIGEHGWRAGFYSLATICAAGGICSIFLIGWHSRGTAPAARPAHTKLTLAQFLALVRQPAFLLLVGGMFLVNMPQILVASQISLLLLENGATPRFAGLAVSLFAACVFLGRVVCGFLLDRVRPHVMAGCFLSLPAIGFLILMSGTNATWLLVITVSLIGLAQGSEGDVGAFLTSRLFALNHYALVFSFVMGSIGAATAVGSLALGSVLHLTDSYFAFLAIAASATVAGALCFLLTGRHLAHEDQGNASLH